MDKLIIKQNTITENVTSELITKLYTNAKEIKDYEELNEIEDSQVQLQGNLQTPNAYDDEVTYLETKFPNLHINVTGGRYIKFEDPEVQRVLLTTYGDGTGITMSDIQAISNIGTLFRGNTTITKFNEFRYFTGITNRTIDWSTGDWFNGCINLREITIPKNVERITGNNYPFNNCTSLKTVIFDTDCVISVCPRFTGCTNLINISLPNSVTSIPGSGFQGCSSLVQFDTNNVTQIQVSAFKSCSSLTSITLSNVTSIGSEAFNSCQALTTVTFNTQTLTQIDGISFEGCSNLVINDLNLPNLTSLGSGAFNGTKIKQISNLGTITSIPNNTFRSCSQLTSVTLPSTVTIIGINSFRECSALTSINLPNITSIDDNAFQNCSSLTSVDLSNCTSIGNTAFQNCTSLTTIGNLSNCTSIGRSAFSNCSNLDKTDWNLSNVTTLGQNSFWGCSKLKGTLNLSGLQTIDVLTTQLFYGCSSLQKIILGHASSVETSRSNVNKSTFYQCNSLKVVDINQLDGIMFSNSILIDNNVFQAFIIRNTNAIPTITLDQGTSYATWSRFTSSSNAKIYVADSLYSTYINHADWSDLASHIEPLSNYVES